MYQDIKHPILILIRGLPGSGKSYLALALQKSLGKDMVVMLDPDATDYKSKAYAAHTKALSREGVDTKLHPYRFLRAKAHKGIATHKIIIWNQPFTNLVIFNKMIANLKAHAGGHDTHLSILVVEVEIDSLVAKGRIEARKHAGGHGPSDNTFNRFINDYGSFSEEGFNTVAVNGQDDVSVSVKAIMKALEELEKQ